MKKDDAIKVACPVCGAAAGDHCDRPLLAPSTPSHYSRRLAARKENDGTPRT